MAPQASGVRPRSGPIAQQQPSAAPTTGVSVVSQDHGRFVKITPAPRFRGVDYSGYTTWSLQFEYWARLQGLWDLYQQEASPPAAAGYSVQQLEQHLKELQEFSYTVTRAYGELLQCLELPEHVQLLADFRGVGEDLPQPHLAWTRLKSVFIRSLPTSNIQVTKQLASYKLQEGESVMDYWRRGRDIKTRYTAAHGALSTESWLTHVLSGLPVSWDPISMIQMQLLPQQTEDGLLAVLLEEEDRRRSRKGSKPDSEALPGEGKRYQSPKKGSHQKGGGSWGGHKKGGPAQKKIGTDGEWGELGPAPPEHCHGCHLRGHPWRECHRRPGDAVPAHLKGKQQQGGKQKGKGKARWNKSADAAAGQGEGESDDSSDLLVATALLGARAEGQLSDWIVDSGASFHFTPYSMDFEGPLAEPDTDFVRIGDGAKLPVTGMGTVQVLGHKGQKLRLTKVHLVPGMHSRLLSVPHLMGRGLKVVFTGDTCRVFKEERLLIQGAQSSEGCYGLLKVQLPIVGKKLKKEAAAYLASVPMQLAHQRLAHAAPSTIKKMVQHGSSVGLNIQEGQDELICEPCLLGKAHKLPFPQVSKTVASAPLELVHMDLWGPASTPTLGQKSVYVLSILDHFSSFVWVKFLQTKESLAVQEVLEQWLTMVERQAGAKLKCIRTDNGTEFKGVTGEWLKGIGVVRQLTTPYTPQQNGRVERWHRTMGEGIRTLLLHSGLPANLWGEALRHVVWVKNRLVHSALAAGKTPHEVWTGSKPDLSLLRTWGCMVCSLLPKTKQEGKLNTRGHMLVHLGVDEESKAWRVLDPDTKVVKISRNLRFVEHQQWQQWKAENPSALLEAGDPVEIMEVFPGADGEQWLEATQGGAPPDTPQPQTHQVPLQSALRRSGRSGGAHQKKEVRFMDLPPAQEDLGEVPEVQPQQQQEAAAQVEEDGDDDLNTLARTNHRVRSLQDLYSLVAEQVPRMLGLEAQAEAEVLAWCLQVAAPDGQVEPKSAAEALAGPQAKEWKAAMQEEMDAMRALGVWDPEPVVLPADKTAVDGKWVFRIKRDQAGKVERFKARYVGRGFTQQKGSDYSETFSSVVKWATIRLLLALATIRDWEVHVVDIKTAFLRAHLKEEVYLQQPAGLGDGTSRVYRLRKALYGLKQSPRCWEQELGKYLVGQGFKRCQSDQALYVRFMPGEVVFVPVYVDDLLVMGEPAQALDKFKQDMKKAFEIQDLGPVSAYLGVQVLRDRSRRTLSLGLPKYISELDRKFQTLLDTVDTSGSGSPMTPEMMKKLKDPERWEEQDAEQVPREQYMSLLGSLMFAALTCRPDLSYSVSLLSQWGTDPRVIHLEALVRVLRYLVGTRGACLVYRGADAALQPCVYTDSDLGSERDGLSRAAWTAKLAGASVSWYSKKLQLVATSSAEAEYKALSEGAKEAMWLKNLLGELQIKTGPIQLYCDNQSAMAISKNPVQHYRTRHFKLNWHFVRQVQEAGEISVCFVRTALQDADMLTKALSVSTHLMAAGRLGLHLNNKKK